MNDDDPDALFLRGLIDAERRLRKSGDLPALHSKTSDTLVWNLSNRVRWVRSNFSEVSKAVKTPTGNAPLPTDAPGQIDAPGDSGCGEGPIA